MSAQSPETASGHDNYVSAYAGQVLKSRGEHPRSSEIKATNRGFTIIELLVVMLIIGILFSLLFPVISRAKRHAKEMKCRHNQRQIWMTHRLALDDEATDKIGEPALARWWLFTVGVPQDVWICPSAALDERRAAIVTETAFRGTVDSAWHYTQWQAMFDRLDVDASNSVIPERRAASYTVNGWLLSYPAFRVPDFLRRRHFEHENEITHPSATPLLGDGVFYHSYPLATDAPPEDLSVGWRLPYVGGAQGIRDYGIARHGRSPSRLRDRVPVGERIPGAVNMTFLDGHVESTELEELWGLFWHRDYNPPVRRPGL